MNFYPNKAAEDKYRHLRPWSFKELGQRSCETDTRSAKTFQDRKRLAAKSKQPVEFRSIPAVCITEDSQNLICSEFATPTVKTCKIHIFDKKGNSVNSFSTEVQNKESPTYGICSTALYDNGIAVCAGNGVVIWNSGGKLISKMSHKDVENCCHITGMKNGLLATTCITEMKGRCVSLWDPRRGKLVGQFGCRPEVVEKNPLKATHKVLIRINDIRLPWFLAANSRDEIFISDRNAKCIKTFDARTGNFLRNFDMHGVSARCKGTLSPQGICIDEDDNLMVVDNIEKSIQIFDRYGEFASTMHCTNEVDNSEPWAISATSEQFFARPMMRSRVAGNNNTRTVAVSMATPDPVVRLHKLTICPHYTEFI